MTRNAVKFSVDTGKRHYMTSKLVGFPIGQVGKCLVQVWAELDGKPVTEKVTLPVAIEHELVNPPEAHIPS